MLVWGNPINPPTQLGIEPDRGAAQGRYLDLFPVVSLRIHRDKEKLIIFMGRRLEQMCKLDVFSCEWHGI